MTNKQLEAVIAYAERGGIKCREWALSKAQSDYTAALCEQSINEIVMGLTWPSLDVAYEHTARRLEEGNNVEHGIVSHPFALMSAAIGAAGLWPQVMQAIRLSIVESNGCVSILVNGTLACSLPLVEWRKRLQVARGLVETAS